MATLKEIAEQADYIHQKSESIGWNNNPVPELEKMDREGWNLDPILGFYWMEDKYSYRVTEITSQTLILIKNELGSGTITATIPTTDNENAYTFEGSEMVELTFQEIFDTLQSLNLAIALHQDGNNQFWEDLI